MRSSRVARAIVIGKFLPPHRGHHALIEHAQGLAEHVDVVVCDGEGQRPAAQDRSRWLASRHPEALVHVVPDICGWHPAGPCPDACSALWAAHLHDLGLGSWDLVVSSEPYGSAFARELGAHHVSFDRNRTEVPCSGTLVRTGLTAGWAWLDPVVRTGLVRKVVVVGAESTGTTTLAMALADELGTKSVPEFGRAETVRLAETASSTWGIEWTSEHFDAIAEGQRAAEDLRLEEIAHRPASFGELGPWMVCDTDLLATSIWRERYLGAGSQEILRSALASPRTPTLYVLTLPQGVPFEQDGYRDGEHLREWMTERFREELAASSVEWIAVTGTVPRRLAAVLGAMKALPPLFRHDGDVAPEPHSRHDGDSRRSTC